MAASRSVASVQSRLDGPKTPAQVLAEAASPRNPVTLEAVRVVVTLGLPDIIASGVAKVDDLASQVEVDPDALRRVLRHLTSRGLFVEPDPGLMALSDAGQLLRTTNPENRNANLLGTHYFEAALKDMLYSVRTGEPAFERVNGAPPWQLMVQDPQLEASFDNDMNDHVRSLAPGLLDAYDWTGISHIVDVGGGSGELLRFLLRALDGVDGTLVEFADAAKRAQRALADDTTVAGRCRVVEGDFFTQVPAGGDAYILSWILHDWADEQAIEILGRCREAAGPEGRVLVIERPLDVSPDTDMDLRMLVFYGGRERYRNEYELLAQQSGLTVRSWTALPSGFCVMDCRLPT